MVGFSPSKGGGEPVSTYETLSLMVAFGILVATIISARR